MPVLSLYAVSSGQTGILVTPNSGPEAGGTSIVITGSGFTGAVDAVLGGLSILDFELVNDGMITGTTDAHVAGLVDLSIQDYEATEIAFQAEAFEYTVSA